jgi:hypothetical protein
MIPSVSPSSLEIRMIPFPSTSTSEAIMFRLPCNPSKYDQSQCYDQYGESDPDPHWIGCHGSGSGSVLGMRIRIQKHWPN